MRIVILIMLFALAGADAATPRPFVSLAGSSVRLSDLFTGLTPGQDQVIGPSPSPGNRIIVPTTQLAAIAAQFGVDWQSGSGAEQVILARPGTPLAMESLLVPLGVALAARGAPDHADIALDAYTPPQVAPGDAITPLVGSLDYNPTTGDFSALITIVGPQTPAMSLRVSGNAAELAHVPVLTHLLPAHQAIEPEDIKYVTLRLPHDGGARARDARQLIGQALRHVVPADVPVPLDDLGTPQAVAANALVEMDLQSGGLSLQARAIAEQAGSVGDHIRVRNPSTLAVMLAEITGPDQVHVDPDSQPIIAAHTQELASR